MDSLSIIVPVHNEQDSLERLFEELAAAIEPLGRPWELIFVDDGSTDKSLAVIKSLAQAHETVHYLSLARRCGLSAVLKAALEAAVHDVVVTVDADLQIDPADIPTLLAALDSGADMVIGWRSHRRDPLLKRLGSRLGNAFHNLVTGQGLKDVGCPLRVVRLEAARRLPLFDGLHRFLPTLMRMQGHRVVQMKIAHRRRRFGRSKYGLWNRALAVGVDVLALRWMQKRSIRYEIKEKG